MTPTCMEPGVYLSTLPFTPPGQKDAQLRAESIRHAKEHYITQAIIAGEKNWISDTATALYGIPDSGTNIVHFIAVVYHT